VLALLGRERLRPGGPGRLGDGREQQRRDEQRADQGAEERTSPWRGELS